MPAEPSGAPFVQEPCKSENSNDCLAQSMLIHGGQQRLSDLGMDPLIESPSAFSARIQRDHEKYGAMIKTAHIKID
jgi:hypothetical protein